MIALEGVRVTYRRTVALHGLDLLLMPGVTGLFGPNGSGKSTLLRVLAGLLRPGGGTVTWGGIPLNISDEAFRARVGYAGHESGLYDRLSVRENLELFGALHGVDAVRVEEMLELVGLQDRGCSPAGELSAGLRRRAAVARALLHEPQLLLLDEPYANLDDDGAGKVSDAIKAWRAPGRMGLVATHGAKRVKGFADATIILQHGKIVSYRVRTPAEAPT
ncbi:MAG: heme ABC exporter ATP-binding protein CcmA [Actinomycetota bacterium]|nr:heme ABC exporter ATP-binding protein CcmA [Actinomycetota bacterium]